MSNKFDAYVIDIYHTKHISNSVINRLKHHVESSDSGSSEEEGLILTDLGPVEYPNGEHRLEHAYCLWFSRRPTAPNRNAPVTQVYSQTLRLVGQVGTVEQWWALYSHLVRLNELPPHTDLHLFKKGIQPMWEDTANSKGGKWVCIKMLIFLYLNVIIFVVGY